MMTMRLQAMLELSRQEKIDMATFLIVVRRDSMNQLGPSKNYPDSYEKKKSTTFSYYYQQTNGLANG